MRANQSPEAANNSLSRRKAVAIALAPLVATGSMLFGAIKLAEHATKAPQGPTPASLKAAKNAANSLSSYPIPRPNFDTVYEAHQDEGASEIVESTYPSLEVGSKKFVLLRNMVNKQIPAFDEYNQEHPLKRIVPLGTDAPIQLTESAHIPRERTEAFYVGDYKNAKNT